MYIGTFAQQTPDKPAVIDAGSGAVLTYRELDDRSNRLAQFFWDTGLRRGDNVALFIAGRIKSNIRELEGALIRLLAYASLTGRDLTLALAQEVLRDVLNHDERAVSIDMIQKFVADYYQLKLVDLKSRNNSKSVAMPRQVAMYLCKQLTNASLPEIGRSFGGKHHSTVIHSIRKVEDQRKNDSSFNSLINTLLESFR